MEFVLHIAQLQLKSEHLHTNPKHTHFHEENENPLFVSWDDCVTVLYSLDGLAEASLWNPIEPVILSISNPVISILTFNSKIYCIDKIGSIYHLKQVQCDSPDLFYCSSPISISQPPLVCSYEWISFHSQKCPCDIFSAVSYSDGIAIIASLGDWIIIQLLKITLNDNDEPTIFNTYSKRIRLQKEFPFSVTSFLSCIWRNWFSSQRAIELFKSNVLESPDIFILATEESKIYCATSDMMCNNAKLFSYSPQNIVHIQLCDFESKKLLLVSSGGILTVLDCVENIPPSFIYLTITKVVTTFIIDSTVIISDGIHLFQITLDKKFLKIIKQVVTPLKGVFGLHRFQLNNIIAITQQNKVYKLYPKYEVITNKEELKFKFNEKSILVNIKGLCKSLESLQNEREKMDKFVNAISSIARKDSVAQNCSMNVLIYSGAKAVKLGASQNEYIFAIKLSTDCAWLSFPSTIWQLLVRVTNNKNSSSHCGLHSIDTNLFNNNHPLIVKHHLLDIIAENCTSGLVYCELICQIQNDLINNCFVIPLNPIKLNSLYFIRVEKQAKIPIMNPLGDWHRYVFEFPEHLSLLECLTILTNRNKHRTSKSLYTNIIENIPKALYLDFFGKIVSVILDDKITKTIILECIDQDTLIAVRNGIFSELSNDQPATIQCSVLADIQKQLCLIEELSMTNHQDENIFREIKTRIQNKISAHIPI